VVDAIAIAIVIVIKLLFRLRDGWIVSEVLQSSKSTFFFF